MSACIALEPKNKKSVNSGTNSQGFFICVKMDICSPLLEGREIITLLWPGGLCTSLAQRAIPVGAYLLAGSPMPDRSKVEVRRKMIHWPSSPVKVFCIGNSNRRNQNNWMNGLSELLEANPELQTGVEDLRCCPSCQRVLRVVRKYLSFQTEVYWEMRRIILSRLSGALIFETRSMVTLRIYIHSYCYTI